MVHNLTPKDLETLVRITHAEAGKESQLGQVAVLHVIKNRMEANRSEFGGSTVQGVVYKPWQFEPTMTDVGRRNMQNVSGEQYRELEKLAEGVFSGQIPDPTGGATHFANVSTVRQRRGGGVTDWMQAKAATAHDIGNHTFFGGDRQQAQEVTRQLQQSGFYDVVSKWQRVLKSSPDHVMAELAALGDHPQAKNLLAELKKSPADEKALNQAVDVLEAQAKEALKREGINTSSRNLAVAEMLGGKTAADVIKADPKAKLSSVVQDRKILAAAGAMLGKDADSLSVEDFLGAVEAAQRQDKQQIADRARGNLSQGNQDFLDQMMKGDMGIMEFLMMFVMLLVVDGMGMDMGGRGQEAPQQPLQPKPTEYDGNGPSRRTPALPLPAGQREAGAPNNPMEQAIQNAGFQRPTQESISGGVDAITSASPAPTPLPEKQAVMNRTNASTAAMS